MQRKPRQRDPDHLAFIRTLPCLICRNESTEACHIRYSSAKWDKVNPGVAQKPDDRYTVPLCSGHHREQHGMKEEWFWNKYAIDPIETALELHKASGDINEAMKVIESKTMTIQFGAYSGQQ